MRESNNNRFRHLFFIGALLAGLAGFFCSCASMRRLPPEKETIYIHTTDSVFFHDTVLMAPVPPEIVEQKVADTDTSRLSTSVAESEAWVKDGELHHTLRNRDVEIPVAATLENHLHSEIKETQRVIFREVEKKLTWWQDFQMSMGKVSMAAMLLIFIIIVVRLIIKKDTLNYS